MGAELARKLQIKEGTRAFVRGAPTAVLAALRDLPEGASVSPGPVRDTTVAVFFVRTRADVADVARKRSTLPVVVWLAYPKKSSGVATELTRDAGWDPLFAAGFVGIASVSIDDTWSGLRVRPGTPAEQAKARTLRRGTGGPRASAPKPARVPPDLARAVAKNAAAKKTLATLAPSHLREYATWIESAKKPETRAARVAKAASMLAAGVRDRNAKYR